MDGPSVPVEGNLDLDGPDQILVAQIECNFRKSIGFKL